MKKIKITLADIGVIVGVVLVAFSIIMLVFTRINRQVALNNSKEIVNLLYSPMPSVEDTVPDDRANITMPAMEINSESFCGILEVDKYGTQLPICQLWRKNRIDEFPCRYKGTLYDGSLIIGGVDNENQLDFAKDITNDDNIFITDMTGGRYKYVVTDIKRTKDVSTQSLTALDADLVLFVKNSRSFDYTVIQCKFNYN